MTAAKKTKPDEIFDKAYKKLGERIDACKETDELVNLCNTLAKMKQVQMKGSDDDGFGSGLGGE